MFARPVLAASLLLSLCFSTGGDAGPRASPPPRRRLRLPLDLTVALFGLDGSGAHGAALDAPLLAAACASLLPERVPGVLDGSHALGVPVTTRVTYSALHVTSSDALGRLEAAIRAAAAPVGALASQAAPVDGEGAPPPPQQPSAAFLVNASQVEAAFFAPAYAALTAEAAARAGGGPVPPLRVLFIVAPDKARLADTAAAGAPPRPWGALPPRGPWGALGWDAAQHFAADGLVLPQNASLPAHGARQYAYQYAYSYDGGAATASWLGHGRWAVVDLSAGPARLGRLNGAASSELPRLADLIAPFADAAAALRAEDAAAAAAATGAGGGDGGGGAGRHGATSVSRRVASLARSGDTAVRGAVAAVVSSAVRHVFAPDAASKAAHVAQRLLIPVTSFADHGLFVPVGGDGGGGKSGADAARGRLNDGFNGGGASGATSVAGVLNLGRLVSLASALLPPGVAVAATGAATRLGGSPRLALALRSSLLHTSRPAVFSTPNDALLIGGGGGNGGAMASAALVRSALLLPELRSSAASVTAAAVEAQGRGRGGGTDGDTDTASSELWGGGGGGGASNETEVFSSGSSQQRPHRRAPLPRRPHPTRVLPVYLFSLRGAGFDGSNDGSAPGSDARSDAGSAPGSSSPAGLLVDGEALHGGDRKALFVLSTGRADAPSPFYASSSFIQPPSSSSSSVSSVPPPPSVSSSSSLPPPFSMVSIDARDPTRAALAGIASAVGGLAPPHLARCPLTGAVLEEWMWASGAHPFGPFSSSLKVSALLLDAAHRHGLASRVAAAAAHVAAARSEAEAFETRFSPAAALASVYSSSSQPFFGDPDTAADAATAAASPSPPPVAASASGRLLDASQPAPPALSPARPHPLYPSALLARISDEAARVEAAIDALLSSPLDTAQPEPGSAAQASFTQRRAHPHAAVAAAAHDALVSAAVLRRFAAEELAAAAAALSCCALAPGGGGGGGGGAGGWAGAAVAGARRRIGGAAALALLAAAVLFCAVARAASASGSGRRGGGGARGRVGGKVGGARSLWATPAPRRRDA